MHGSSPGREIMLASVRVCARARVWLCLRPCLVVEHLTSFLFCFSACNILRKFSIGVVGLCNHVFVCM